MFLHPSLYPPLSSASAHPTSPPLNSESLPVLKHVLHGYNKAGSFDLKEDLNE